MGETKCLSPNPLQTTAEGRAALEACNVAAGLSLGEYTALAFAGAFSFEVGTPALSLCHTTLHQQAQA